MRVTDGLGDTNKELKWLDSTRQFDYYKARREWIQKYQVRKWSHVPPQGIPRGSAMPESRDFNPTHRRQGRKVDKVGCLRLDIERNIPVDQLIRAKYQDNLEFLQWVKCFWEREGGLGRLDYDPVAAREGKTLPPWDNLPERFSRCIRNVGQG
ncbi:Microtubule-associated protein RP/EB family member 1 [Symbiodinium microadriaticum]|uniref:Microtubule-associated protein RP/EB family member 1 n=1 Tax=Symbiodinium microadriaticum TaxID=2951 RepID=A0A1Q9BXG4_SYMMI|nr:Microtubule-associated protein RP/EB family member 1 [Symbiodinium microadriaticum]